jgi:hypothetical protein
MSLIVLVTGSYSGNVWTCIQEVLGLNLGRATGWINF